MGLTFRNSQELWTNEDKYFFPSQYGRRKCKLIVLLFDLIAHGVCDVFRPLLTMHFLCVSKMSVYVFWLFLVTHNVLDL